MLPVLKELVRASVQVFSKRPGVHPLSALVRSFPSRNPLRVIAVLIGATALAVILGAAAVKMSGSSECNSYHLYKIQIHLGLYREP